MTVPVPPSPDTPRPPTRRSSAARSVAGHLNRVVGEMWRSVEIWDLTERLALHEAALPPEARRDLQQLRAASVRLEEDLHRLEAAYQVLAEYVETAAAADVEPEAGR